MNFTEKLNEYIEKLDCSAKELSDVSHISPAVISRYRSGERIPKYPSEQFDSLVLGIETLAKNNKKGLSSSIIIEELIASLGIKDVDFETFRNNLNTLISTLNINVADMSRYIGYDSSYLSKIRAGTRKPQNLNDFISAISKYVANNYTSDTQYSKLTYLINIEHTNIANKEIVKEALIHFLSDSDNIISSEDPTESFLNKLDDFDLNEYIKSIHFDTLKVPTIPMSFPKAKSYYGLNGFKDSQIDILKSIALSKSRNDIYFYSNMSMVEASKDLEFTKKFMFGLAACLKKGLRINIIHDLDRPFKELMLGLEGWIPLYMTGLINPHYLKSNANELYSHLTCTNDSIALNGYYATGNINNAVFYLTNKKEELGCYINNTKTIWKKSFPLMDIYTSEKKTEFYKLFEESKEIKADRINIFSNLPFYTMSEKLLKKILDRNNIDSNDKKLIIEHLKHESSKVIQVLKDVSFTDEISILSEKDFNEVNPTLSLSYMFYDKKIQYSYEEYLEHIELIKEFSKKYRNYSYKQTVRNPFKNINLSIICGNRVLISKENAPSIHFLVYHPILVDAIEKIEIQLKDKE